MSTETMERSELEEDENWARSIGKKWYCTHYRERDGTRHAVCPPRSGVCQVHEDKENAHTNPVSHLVKDAPEVLVIAGVSVLVGPQAAKKLWKFLP